MNWKAFFKGFWFGLSHPWVPPWKRRSEEHWDGPEFTKEYKDSFKKLTTDAISEMEKIRQKDIEFFSGKEWTKTTD